LPYWLYRVAALRRASSVAFAVYVSLHIHSANLMISSRGVPWGNMHERLNDSGSGEWTITRCWKATLSKSRWPRPMLPLKHGMVTSKYVQSIHCNN
jgi:hypothetical protein